MVQFHLFCSSQCCRSCCKAPLVGNRLILAWKLKGNWLQGLRGDRSGWMTFYGRKLLRCVELKWVQCSQTSFLWRCRLQTEHFGMLSEPADLYLIRTMHLCYFQGLSQGWGLSSLAKALKYYNLYSRIIKNTRMLYRCWWYFISYWLIKIKL